MPVLSKEEKIYKQVEFELDISKQTFAFLPFVDSEQKHQVRLTETGARSCWGIQDLGNWGYVLIGAELGGGKNGHACWRRLLEFLHGGWPSRRYHFR